MALHFSIGFVVERRPKVAFDPVCAVADDVDVMTAYACREQSVTAVLSNSQTIILTWPRELGECQ